MEGLRTAEDVCPYNKTSPTQNFCRQKATRACERAIKKDLEFSKSFVITYFFCFCGWLFGCIARCLPTKLV